MRWQQSDVAEQTKLRRQAVWSQCHETAQLHDLSTATVQLHFTALNMQCTGAITRLQVMTASAEHESEQREYCPEWLAVCARMHRRRGSPVSRLHYMRSLEASCSDAVSIVTLAITPIQVNCFRLTSITCSAVTPIMLACAGRQAMLAAALLCRAAGLPQTPRA